MPTPNGASPAHPRLSWAAGVSWRLLVLGLTVYAFFYAAGKLQLVVTPIILALFVTAVLWRPVRALRRTPVPRAVGALAGAVLFVAAVGGAALAAALVVGGQRSAIFAAVQNGWISLRSAVKQSDGTILGFALDDLLARLTELIEAQGPQAAEIAAAGAVSAITIIAELALAACLAFFLLRDGDKLTARFLNWLTAENKLLVERIGEKVWIRLEGYLRGLAITAVVNSLLKGLALLIIGVPFVLPIMFLTFVGSFIPFVGPILATSVAALVALASGDSAAALWVLAAGVTIQQVEGNVLHPWLIGKSVDLPPTIVLLVVATGGAAGGLMGAFIAIPLTAAVFVIAHETRSHALTS